MSSVVLDASAVLAVLHRERGGEVVEPVLHGATMSAVNYGEVLKKTVEFNGSLAKVELFLTQQRLQIVPFVQLHARVAAEIYPETKTLGLSFADRACLSLGKTIGRPIYTAEQRFAEANIGVEIKLIRGTL